MDKIGAYNAYQRINEQTVVHHVSMITGMAEVAQTKDLYNWETAGSVELSEKAKELIWGRVILKGKVDSAYQAPVSRRTGREHIWIGANPVMSIVMEPATALELSQKTKNTDRRNVTQRTFSRGDKKLDVTV